MPFARLARLATFAIPFLTLLWVWPWRSDAPEPIDWRAFVGEAPLRFGRENAFAFDGEPNRYLARWVHTLTLDLPGASFKRSALLGILVAAGFWIATLRLVRRLFPNPGAPATAALAMLAFTVSVFSPRHGADFLLDARFRVFVPAFALVLAVLALGPSTEPGLRAWRWRFVFAALLAHAALACDRLGDCVWIALVPLVAHAAARAGGARPLLVVAGWCFLGNLGSVFVRDEVAASASSRPGLFRAFAERPLAALEDLLRVLGHGLPDPWPRSPAAAVVVGAGLALALLCLLVPAMRGDRARRSRTMPLVSCGLFGIASAFASIENDWPPNLVDALRRELTFGQILLPFAIAGLLAVLAPRRAVTLARVGVPLVLLGLAYETWRELPRVEREHRLLRQGEALLAFSEHGERMLPKSPRRPVTDAAVIATLRTRGLLRSSIPWSALGLADIRTRPKPEGAPLGTLETFDGSKAAGQVQDLPGTRAPDLVALSRTSPAQAERLFALAAPAFLDAGPLWIWSADLTGCEPLAEGEVVRAYGVNIRSYDVTPLDGSFVVSGGRPVRHSGGGK